MSTKAHVTGRGSPRAAIPRVFNIGVDVAIRQDSEKLALVEISADGKRRLFSFGDIGKLANRAANAFRAHGFRRGERVAIILSQRHEAAVSHIAIYLCGMIAVPLFTLFGEEALDFRLRDCAAAAIVCDLEGLSKIARIRERLPALRRIYCVDGETLGAVDFRSQLEQAADRFEPERTLADDPALIIYTSGTTGNPKGALHAHRVLLGHLRGVEFPHNGFPQPGDRFWTPADWAWIGGLLDVLLPSWHHGVPVVAYRSGKFDPAEALGLMARCRVRNVFMPPTALRLLRQSGATHPELSLRTVASGGESLGVDLIEWGRETFGLTINEFYGQTECNLVLGNGEGLPPARAGWTGTPIPGHVVRIVDDDGRAIPHGTAGHIAVERPDPVMFLGYWGNEAATRAKFAGDWLITGDVGIQDEAGYTKFIGRDDDIITSAGYRIGPGEIESCLSRHPAVAMAGVVGVPDPIRTEIVKAVIVLAGGFAPTPQLAEEIRSFVKKRLSAHEYPRIIEFAARLPLTATGKVIRRLLRESRGERSATGSGPESQPLE